MKPENEAISMNKQVRVRFAPSPTGYLHVGGARTALFNYLFARHNQGTFILRIEDTDRTRYQEEALTEIYESLKWLGLTWDEGPGVGGKYGPYIQSERTDLYRQYARQLVDEGKAYPCFCSSERLEQVRLEREKNKEQVQIGYDRHCRDIDPKAAAERMAAGESHVIRLKVPVGETVVFDDQIRGRIETASDLLDDLVLLKSDLFPTYHLANVVDDHHMEISHVLRGDEWIATTPRHVLLYRALGWTPPVFAHLPVILAQGGGKLSKRKGAASVMDYQRAGYLPAALFNFLALLGWNPGDERELMKVEELIASFTLERITPKASVFDEQKLEWMNGNYMAEAQNETLLDLVMPLWLEKGWITLELDRSYLLGVVDLMKSRSKKVTELGEGCSYYFTDPDEYEEKAARKRFTDGADEVLGHLVDVLEKEERYSITGLEEIFQGLCDRLQISAGKLIHPTRLAISGLSFGPGLFELMAQLGKETVLRRLKRAVSWIREHGA